MRNASVQRRRHPFPLPRRQGFIQVKIQTTWRFSHARPSPAPTPVADRRPPRPGSHRTLIGLRNIEKSYAHGTSRSYVLRRITADIKEGEFVSIMGPSGAGKSTLLHILGMHDSAWTGEYLPRYSPCTSSRPRTARLQKQHIGFVFQSYHLLDNLTVYENIDLRSPIATSRSPSARAWSPTSSIASRSSARRISIRTSSRADSSSSSGSRARSSRIRRDSGRRADRQPALEPGQGDHGAVPEAERRRHDDRPGDALGSQRRLRQPDHPAARTAGSSTVRRGRARDPAKSATPGAGPGRRAGPCRFYQRGSFLRPPP